MGWFRLGSDDECPHPSTVEVTTNGLKRVVCEGCGHVAIRRVPTSSSDIERARFARRQ